MPGNMPAGRSMYLKGELSQDPAINGIGVADHFPLREFIWCDICRHETVSKRGLTTGYHTRRTQRQQLKGLRTEGVYSRTTSLAFLSLRIPAKRG
jgi:hypothetical protein